MSDKREQLARRIAGEVVLSDDPGTTLRKWRDDFDISQTSLAAQLEVSPSVVSDYESGRRQSPGISVVRRIIEALLDVDDDRGGEQIRRYTRILSAGFDNDVVHDLQEYSTPASIGDFYAAIDATEVVSGSQSTIAGHTVIDSIEVITRLSSEDFYRLYGQSTNRALVFTNVTRGESPLVAQRVVTPTPSAVVLHGIEEDDLWEHAPALAAIDGYSLAVSDAPLDVVLKRLRSMP
ncbi:helix-turn-helix domain-containing protein [Halocatena halophila]|uniref:helix-turn-helix domain-containing protein n=1 Tax=Halocatena halophila TaxID=2814576 RepID=UPI002ED1A8D8